ncbi:MAG: hypothetical protein HWE18_02390 [Gammaproteobacteria bacterium]|nr:hypothetical protein [Gammaproteobacteria bacterium]
MDQESIVYGIIKDVPTSPEMDGERRRMVNSGALLDLPQTFDVNSPFLCGDMFTLPGFDVFSGAYHTQLIHFGASYRAVEYEWERWMQKFEELLSKMYWVSATVHLETELSGKHTFHWEPTSRGCHVPNSGDIRVKCEWEREAAFMK